MRTVLGIVGQQAAGKGAIASYLEKAYGAKKLRFSGPLTDILRRLRIPFTRDNQIKLAETLRATFGPSVLTAALIADAADTDGLVTIDGLRKPGDLEELKTLPGFHLLAVAADIHIRYGRSKIRGEKPEDATITFEDFEASHLRSTEITIPELEAQAEFKIPNDGTIEELYARLDGIMAGLGVEETR